MDLNIGKITITIKKRKDRWKSWYESDYKEFMSSYHDNKGFPVYKNHPCLNERKDSAGFIDNPYFPQDMYVARKIYQNQPQKHVDIGSRLDGFVAHIAVFREIEVFDIRPMQSKIHNILFTQADFTDGESLPTNYCDSVSCLHALEHFGLGRYGDKIDPEGHLKGFSNITKILKPGGTFYFSVPMGVQRIEFNAHRIFGMPYLINWVKKDYSIESFAYIDDNCVLHEDVILSEKDISESYNCNHGCAIFELKKNS